MVQVILCQQRLRDQLLILTCCEQTEVTLDSRRLNTSRQLCSNKWLWQRRRRWWWLCLIFDLLPLWFGLVFVTADNYLRQRRRLCFTLVCFSVCQNVQITEKVVNRFWRNFLEGRAWPRDQVIKFWWWSGPPSGSGSLKSEVWIHWIIEKVTSGFWWNFMESWGVA